MHLSADDSTPIVIDENAAPAARLRPYHVLAAVPTVGLLAGIPWANRVEPYVLGLPFLLFWVVMWVVTTSGIMALIATLDARHDEADARAADTTTTVTRGPSA